ncbi:unnamed protein product [Miscanthus lutarioriparius]|uniref:Uncharacterized protein n=1 Tax=Miscanthus lutarioriparius TaxID=422564 RepID=A0A811N211_9POAL|nr:unnamed protein product [Miscanthus lutarioriparius]
MSSDVLHALLASFVPCSLHVLFAPTAANEDNGRIVHAMGKRRDRMNCSRWKKDTKITFVGKANRHWNQLRADLVFLVDEKLHPVYQRDGNDLLAEALFPVAGGASAALFPWPASPWLAAEIRHGQDPLPRVRQQRVVDRWGAPGAAASTSCGT